MQAFKQFSNADASFWAFIKFISETLGYTVRGKGAVKEYSAADIYRLCENYHMSVDGDRIKNAVRYCHMRADILNNFVQGALMDAETANKEYLKLQPMYEQHNFKCKIPLNKQKGDMKQIAYYTAIINILAEKTIREITHSTDTVGFDDDPRRLTYIWDDSKQLIGALSRRFDGAYPSSITPKIVWEIKEYYYATTFGSRVADGVYETQLDGFEFKEIFDRTGYKVFHVLFVDAYRTWWIQGKSYLCRIIDALNAGLVDEVIVGKEVLTRWPELLKMIVTR